MSKRRESQFEIKNLVSRNKSRTDKSYSKTRKRYFVHKNIYGNFCYQIYYRRQ